MLHGGAWETLVRDAGTQDGAHSSLLVVAARVGGGPPLRRNAARALRGREDGVPHLREDGGNEARTFLLEPNVQVCGLTSICIGAEVVAGRGVATSGLLWHHRVKDREECNERATRRDGAVPGALRVQIVAPRLCSGIDPFIDLTS